jgi:hypothetical protein
LIGIVIMVALTCTGTIYQLLGSKADALAYPAPGRLVDVVVIACISTARRAGIVSHPYLPYAVPDKRDAIAALTSRTAYWDMIYPETNVHTLDIDAEQVRSSRRFLGNMPILILSAGSGYPDDSYRQHWLDDQAELLSLSSRTEQRIIEGASHVSLTTERTAVVRDALESILAKIQS